MTSTGARERRPATEPLRWGLIGSGLIAKAFADDLTVTDSGRVVAIGSRSQESADRFADKFGIPNRHASYEALVADPDVDVVYVATPHPMHLANALLALEAGKPVLVEKAFTMNADEARELVASARAKGLFAMEAMWTRFLPHIAEVNRLLAAGALGDIVTVMADHGQWFPKDPAFRLFAPELGGGALLDCGVYPVSFASMVLGKPARSWRWSPRRSPVSTGRPRCSSGTPAALKRCLTCTSSAKTPVRRHDRRYRGPHRDRQPLLRTFVLHSDRPGRGMLPASNRRTRAKVCITRPRRSRAALGPGCWRAP